MASPTYTTRALVLRKTKLGESDLVLTLLAQDGSQIRAVAKGARKPANSFSARLELYSVVDVLCSKGRSLDVISEARLVASNERLRLDMEHAAAAAPMAELLDKMTQHGLESPRLFACTETALRTMGEVPAAHAPLVCAAYLLKALAFSGLRPNFALCTVCGAPVDVSQTASSEIDFSSLYLSFREGGLICADCRSQVDARPLSPTTVAWANYLLGSTFSEIAEAAPAKGAVGAAFAVLHFCHEWIREHVGCSLKSLNFLFSCGLYEEGDGANLAAGMGEGRLADCPTTPSASTL